jgi:hypothetical protein
MFVLFTIIPEGSSGSHASWTLPCSRVCPCWRASGVFILRLVIIPAPHSLWIVLIPMLSQSVLMHDSVLRRTRCLLPRSCLRAQSCILFCRQKACSSSPRFRCLHTIQIRLQPFVMPSHAAFCTAFCSILVSGSHLRLLFFFAVVCCNHQSYLLLFIDVFFQAFPCDSAHVCLVGFQHHRCKRVVYLWTFILVIHDCFAKECHHAFRRPVHDSSSSVRDLMTS